MIRRIDRPSFLAGLLTVVTALALMGQVNVPTFPVTIAHGGTGQATATAAFDALAPTTTRGDIITRGASNNIRVAAGTSGQFLKTLGSGADAAFAAVPALVLEMGSGAAAGHSPLDSTSYFFATPFTTNPGSTAAVAQLFMPIACTMRAVYFRSMVFGTLGSSETFTVSIRINDTTDVTVTAAAKMDAASNDSSNTGLSTALAVGDKVQIKMVTPAWVTNPTAAFYQAELYCDVP